mgnify:CR=1 FL=1
MTKKRTKSIVFETKSLKKAFDKLHYYSIIEQDSKRTYYLRLEFGAGDRKTFIYTNSSDAHDRLLGYYRKFIKLQVGL